MKRILVLMAALALLAPLLTAQPCSVPPFLANVSRPNILLVLDASGSMGGQAYYKATGAMTYDTLWWGTGATRPSYGYFIDDSLYNYDSSATGKFFYSVAGGKWPGWVLNWAAMTRADVIRKVLVGGKRVGDSLYTISTAATGNTPGSGIYWPKFKRMIRDASNRDSFVVSSGSPTTINARPVGPNPPINAILKNARLVIRRPSGEIMRGVIDQIGDKDQNGLWDDDAPKIGFWTFDRSGSNEGGYMVDYPGHDSLQKVKRNITSFDPSTMTPLAENLYEITRWVAQLSPAYNSTDYTVAASPNWYRDPYYDEKSAQWAPCTKTFVVFMTDGEPTSDDNIPSSGTGLPGNPNLTNYYTSAQGNVSGTLLDDVSFYAHRADLRTTSDMPGNQNITFYGIYCFGTGNVLMQTCKVGGFKCDYSTDQPDTVSEYSTDGDTIPDNYFEADDGYQMEAQIRAALVAIMASSASSSAVSVIAGSSNGEGTVQQAYFAQDRIVGPDEVRWPGFLRALWVDRYGNIREDTNNDRILTIKGNATNSDRVVHFFSDPGNGSPMDSLFADTSGTGKLQFSATTPADSLKDVWNAGKWLYNCSYSSRKVYTDTGTARMLIYGNGSSLQSKMGAASAGEADQIISYVLGRDTTGWRPRKFSGTEWKLGDIIYASPTFVGKPAERYDQLYGDNSYAQFYAMYKNRHNVVLQGANDGMIHCFFAGNYTANTVPQSSNVGWIDSSSIPLGKELWAYVPKNLLPHLKWLKATNYCHVYYNDLKAKVSDVKIWPTSDAVHKNGWGTVAVVGMRLGGDTATTAGTTWRSAYVCFDVTVPDSCKPMWEYTASDLGFTVSYPCIAAFDSACVATTPKFYAVFGGGPDTKDGISTRTPKVYVVNIKTGALAASYSTTDANCAIGDMISSDIDLNFRCDVIYFGTYSATAANTGRLYRLVCRTGSSFAAGTESSDPATTAWTLNRILSPGRPFFAAPTIAIDQKGINWVYAGTGRYFKDADETDNTVQYLYGMRDPNLKDSLTVSQLLYANRVLVRSQDSVSRDSGTTWGKWSTFIAANDTMKGWYRILPQTVTGGNTYSERVLTKTAVIGGALFASAFQPSGDPCALGGYGSLYALFYTTGTAYRDTIIQRQGATNYPVKVSLGAGVPSAPSLHVGSNGQSAFIQTPTGAILNIGTMLPYNPRSGNIFWKQQ
ncbi:MAG TPA: PilC/PilY family type IV pilus protein [Candidatus Edwardsbacteria bacterium]|nr:PilC/PilY family type IV pilus protein [Candidatus Edwardsbacteria bacterium]